MNKGVFILALSAVLLAGCMPAANKKPTSLQIQAFQTKQFDASKNVAFNSVLSVFQDLGYIVQSASKDTGFITASSPTKNKTGFWNAMAGVAASGNTKATAFIEEIRPGHAQIRLNFVSTNHMSSAYGRNSEQDTPILKPKVYQVAFDKIGDAIFIRQGTNGKDNKSPTHS